MNTLLVQKSGAYVCLVARVLYSLFLDKYWGTLKSHDGNGSKNVV